MDSDNQAATGRVIDKENQDETLHRTRQNHTLTVGREQGVVGARRSESEAVDDAVLTLVVVVVVVAVAVAVEVFLLVVARTGGFVVCAPLPHVNASLDLAPSRCRRPRPQPISSSW